MLQEEKTNVRGSRSLPSTFVLPHEYLMEQKCDVEKYRDHTLNKRKKYTFYPVSYF